MTALSLVIAALAAGFVSFASPCVLPLVPSYVGNMVGVLSTDTRARRRAALPHATAFVVGFSIVFVALWASLGLVGSVLHSYAPLLRELGGSILVFFGLQVAGVISIPALYREFHLPIGRGAGGAPATLQRNAPPSFWRSALLGVVFAAGWTPCIGPTLGGIIGLASASASVAQGTVLLVAYSIGLGIPFILVAIGATSVTGRLAWFRRHQVAVERATGGFLVLVGFLMLTNTFARLAGLLPGIRV